MASTHHSVRLFVFPLITTLRGERGRNWISGIATHNRHFAAAFSAGTGTSTIYNRFVGGGISWTTRSLKGIQMPLAICGLTYRTSPNFKIRKRDDSISTSDQKVNNSRSAF